LLPNITSFTSSICACFNNCMRRNNRYTMPAATNVLRNSTLLPLSVKLMQLALPSLPPPSNFGTHSSTRRILPSLLKHRRHVGLQHSLILRKLLAQSSKRALLSAGVRLMRSLQPGNPTPRIITNNRFTPNNLNRTSVRNRTRSGIGRIGK
jgi:hypothetical protein